jgi:hypothetical protein
VIGSAVEQAADEAHGGWKGSKVAYRHLKSASQLIASVGPLPKRQL